jgi:multiple sugar transport system substrate-binding protein/raffinose/stachyose/melibiose transport system substrate-binding protein
MTHGIAKLAKKRFLSIAALSIVVVITGGVVPTANAASGTVALEHYFSGDLGQKAFDQIFPVCEKAAGVKIAAPTIAHEAFKDAILVQLAGGNPPDMFSYWAGAKTQSLIDAGQIGSIDDMWKSAGLDSVIPKSIANSAATYGGKKYLIPFDYHYVGMFYNPAVLKKAGITKNPTTWAELMSAAAKLKAKGITPFAMGSKNAWPAQFWFDYILLRTAGPDYRAKLMAGTASYTDPQVKTAFAQWKTVLDKGYFNTSPNGIDWTDAADQVSSGKAAMTLMGTWVTGYWDGKGLKAGTNYNFFPFPVITKGVPQASLGPVDGWVMATKGKNNAGAKALMECMAGPEAQKVMALTQGALAPNSKTDLSGQSKVMQAAAKQVAGSAAFVFNYDLATPPAASAIGLDMFVEFIGNPKGANSILSKAQTKIAATFSK